VAAADGVQPFCDIVMDRIGRVEIGDRVRAAAMDSGILPNDPLGPVVDELAGIPAEVELRIAPMLAKAEAILSRIEATGASIEKAARRPMLTSNQIQDDLLPGLLTAFEGLRALATVFLLMIGIGVGIGIHWMLSPTLMCGANIDGRPLCYRWDGPAPPKQPQADPAAANVPPATRKQ
jgi:hypothetical protein